MMLLARMVKFILIILHLATIGKYCRICKFLEKVVKIQDRTRNIFALVAAPRCTVNPVKLPMMIACRYSPVDSSHQEPRGEQTPTSVYCNFGKDCASLIFCVFSR